MIKTKEEVVNKEGLGVIIGRFQTDELHEGHVDLFHSVMSRHEKTICILGLSPLKAKKKNSLDFQSRAYMIKERFPEVEIYYNKDQKEDSEWASKIDEIVETHTPPEAKVVLYGSRDSFIKHYGGRYDTKELIQESFTSATEVRKQLAYKSGKSKEFRRGVLWATQNQYDTAYCAVDVAIVDFHTNRILLGRKSHEKDFRLIGGFVDPRTQDTKGGFLEINARREVMEETTLVVEQLDYVDSFVIDDYRYRGEDDIIFSTTFIGHYVSGRPEPKDDICELKWFDLQPNEGVYPIKIDKNVIVKEHHALIDSVLNKLNINALSA